MFVNNRKEIIFGEIDRIAQTIISKSSFDSGHLTWKTVTVRNREYSRAANASLYSGVSGIALFLLYASKVTNNQKYLEGALGGLKWSIETCRENSLNHTFFTGQLGVAYVCCKAFDLTGDTCYLAFAQEIGRRVSEEPHAIEDNDLLIGTAGVIIGLLHLHQRFPEDFLFRKICDLTIKLLNGSHLNNTGLSWDKSGKTIRGLCGFSHGAAGIGWLFLELGKYFRNPAFYWVSRQAFAYENSHFDSSKKNWPDFRKGIWSHDDFERYKEEYFKQNHAFFSKTGFMNAWCHGAAGIGFSRLEAWKTLEEEIYLTDALNCSMKVEEDLQFDQIKTWTLCHGQGGNLDLLTEMGATLGKMETISIVQNAATQAIAAHEHRGTYVSGYAMFPEEEDYSLFMGTSGIGYFYLRSLFPTEIDCILAPRLQPHVSSVHEFNLSLDSIKWMTINQYFHRSAKYCSERSSDQRQKHVQNLTQIFDDHSQGKNRKVTIADTLDPEFQELVSLENDIVDMALSAEPGCLTELRIAINKELVLRKTKLDPELYIPRMGSHVRLNKDSCILIVTKPKGLATYPLSDFSAALFNMIDGQSTVAMIARRLMNLIPGSQYDQALNLVGEQLIEFMSIGVLDCFE